MDRVVIESAGGYDKLKFENGLPIPTPGPNEVLIRTLAIGVNYADVCVRMGLYSSAKKYVGWPITPGFEYSGVIEAIGCEAEDYLKAKGLQLHSQVFGVTRFFAYSTHIIVSKEYILPIPKNLSVEAAAGFPAVFLTAYYGLFELGNAKKGQSVLVHSAAGGVGSALVQLAKAKGCKIVGVVGSSHKVQNVKDLGADHVIDKSKQDLWKCVDEIQPNGFDVVLDANGVSTLKESYNHVAAGGRLIIYGFHSMLPKTGGKPSWPKLAWDWMRTPSFNPLEMTGANKSVMAFNLSYLFDRIDIFESIMNELVQMVEDKEIQGPVVKTYPFSEVIQSHKDIESGNTVGKLILLPEGKEKKEEGKEEKEEEEGKGEE